MQLPIYYCKTKGTKKMCINASKQVICPVLRDAPHHLPVMYRNKRVIQCLT